MSAASLVVVGGRVVRRGRRGSGGAMGLPLLLLLLFLLYAVLVLGVLMDEVVVEKVGFELLLLLLLLLLLVLVVVGVMLRLPGSAWRVGRMLEKSEDEAGVWLKMRR
jgi:Mn2+/Fe2+ NRAMP family transporter